MIIKQISKTYTAIFLFYLLILLSLGFILDSEKITKVLSLGFEASASTSNVFINLSSILRSGIAFSAGLVAVFNPCGFALLSVYLSYFMKDSNTQKTQSVHKTIYESTIISTTVTIGFIIVFFIFGLMISGGFYSLKSIFSYVGILISMILLGYGFYVLSGGMIYFSRLSNLSNTIGSSNEKSLRFYFYYGISYGLTSLSCSLPIFMSIVFSFSNTSSLNLLIKDFILFSMGAWFSLIIVSLSLLFLKSFLEKIKLFFKIYNLATSIILIISGSYLILYWMSEFKI
ncbi:MAG: hypothetical protein CL772_00010 [Chloroflexi bacterium]|nr:hypothetical protein [Chloroflexota bacterium]